MQRLPFAFAALIALPFAACTASSSPVNAVVPGAGDGGTASGQDAGQGSGSDTLASGADGAGTDGAGSVPNNATPAKAGLETKDLSFAKAKTTKERFDLCVGSYPVVIFATRAANVAKLGAGSLELARDGSMASMTLKTASGQLISTMTANIDTPNNGIVNSQAWGFLSLAQDDHPGRGTDVLFSSGVVPPFGSWGLISPPGQINGSVGLEGFNNTGDFLYFFRNNVEYAGAKVPAVFGQLAGTYKGPRVTKLGGQPDVTVQIAANGEVTVSGLASLSQKDTQVVAKWDGNDDYIAPIYEQGAGGGQGAGGWKASGKYEIFLDSLNFGGSRPGGGVRIVVPALETLAAAPQLVSVQVPLAGSEGNLEVNAPAKQ